MKIWNWMAYIDESGYCTNQPACHLTKQAAEEQLELWKRIYPDAELQVVANKAGGWGVKIIIENRGEL